MLFGKRKGQKRDSLRGGGALISAVDARKELVDSPNGHGPDGPPSGRAPREVPARPLFANTFDRYRWLMRNPAQQTAADEAFVAAYRQGEEYADMKELLEIEGIA